MTASRARDALSRYFGFTEFREGQSEVIESILEGEDVLVVMPTGGGKSLCYQLPAMMLDGTTLVVSPLIALMKDQNDALANRGIPTTFINSSLSYSEVSQRLSAIRRGSYKVVYVAPERFRSESFTRSISEARVRLLAIDEAHCISHWGHDFRPDYMKLRHAAELLGRPQLIALTATATPKVRSDISEQLGLSSPRVFVAGFDRPNLRLGVVHVGGDREKLAILEQMLGPAGGSGIVYAATRKGVEQVAAKLLMSGISALPYHAGMEDRERTRAQETFMEGRSRAIVATNAFGMGIDKPDIRFVVHYNLPGSIEAYYQEVGRAGRDGLPSDCTLLFNYADTRTQQFFIEGSHPPPSLIERVYREITTLGSEAVELSARELAGRLQVKNEMSVYSALAALERAGHIERGRTAGTPIMLWLKTRVDEALDKVADGSFQGSLLRELVFNRGITDRDRIEIDLLQLASALGLAQPTVRRAVTELGNQGIIGHRAVFSGRGIRLLDERPEPILRIDRKELAARAAAEQWKLRKMLDYCYASGCLRAFVLNYFGDRKRVDRCETCSNCARAEQGTFHGKRTGPRDGGTLTLTNANRSRPMERTEVLDRFIIEEAPSGSHLRAELRKQAELNRAQFEHPGGQPPVRARNLAESETIVVKKVLSCVARLNGKFGKGTVAAVLRGSKSKQVLQSGLDKLTTYGLLRDMSQDEINSFIIELVRANCIAISRGAYPTARLTDFGREVMRGRAEVLLELPDR